MTRKILEHTAVNMMGAAGVLFLFMIPVNCTSDPPRPLPIAERMTPPPPIAQPVAETGNVEADSALAPSDAATLSLRPHAATASPAADDSADVLVDGYRVE